MDPTYRALDGLRQRIEHARDDAERASLLGEVVAVLDAATPALPPEVRDLPLAQARRELGERLESLGRHAEAETQLDLALRALDQIETEPSVREVELARCYYALGDMYRATRRTAQALDSYGAAVARFERLVGHDHEGRVERALALSREALAAAASELAEEGRALRLVRPVEAARAFTRAIAAFESLPAEVQDEFESTLAGCYNEIGSALAIAGRFEDAVSAFQRCVSRFEKLAARDPARFERVLAIALSGLAATFRELARWNESIDVSKRAVDLYERLRLADTSSFFDLKLGTELAHIREAQTRANPGSALPTAAQLGTRGSSRWLIGKIDFSGTDRSSSPQPEPSVDGQAARPAPAPRRAPPAGLERDRRLWCTSAGGLLRIVDELLDRGHRSTNVHTLAKRLRETQSYPARDFAQHCLPRRPDLFVTYNWDENFVDLQGAIHSGVRAIAGMIRANRPELQEERIDRLCLDEIGIWIDFLFIDQNARDVLDEVNTVVPAAIDAADVHFVLSPTALSRAWCCYELALFHQRAMAEEGSPTLRSFIAPIGTVPYRGFSDAKTSNPADKPVLEQWLRAHYPGGVDGVDALLMMSGLLSDSFVVSGDAWPEAAETTVIESVDRWLAR
jgi:tetratricopeptide (TPR) repeat protein